MVNKALFSKIKALSVADRLELIGAVWDSLPAGAVPLTEAEKALLDARLADLEANPSDGIPWSEVKERLKR
jgi:putative addiction module component (TIGR02574 family)